MLRRSICDAITARGMHTPAQHRSLLTTALCSNSGQAQNAINLSDILILFHSTNIRDQDQTFSQGFATALAPKSQISKKKLLEPLTALY